MRAFNKKRKLKHTTKGKFKKWQYDDVYYFESLFVKKVSIEHYEADKYWVFRYNLEKVCKDGFVYDGNWFSAKEHKDWLEVYFKYRFKD